VTLSIIPNFTGGTFSNGSKDKTKPRGRKIRHTMTRRQATIKALCEEMGWVNDGSIDYYITTKQMEEILDRLQK
jgi:hypothetical protein